MAAELILLPPATKTCTKCNKELSIHQFSKNRSKKDGFHNWCKRCDIQHKKEYYAAHKMERLQTNKAYSEANRRQVAEYRKAYRRTYKRTIGGFTTEVWVHLNSRTTNGSHPQWSNSRARRYLDRGVELHITRDELKAIITTGWSSIQVIWAAGEIVSIDRMDGAALIHAAI